MEKLIMLYQQQTKILDNLGVAINRLHKKPADYDTYRESVVQRFEIAVEFFWKYLKHYVDIKLGMPAEISAPRPLIRHCTKVGLISELESEQLLWMIDARNMTSHIYREEIAEELVHKIDSFYSTLKSLHERLTPHAT